MPRNMVVNKLKYLIGLARWSCPSPSLNFVQMRPHAGAELGSIVEGVTLIYSSERMGKSRVGDSVSMRVS